MVDAIFDFIGNVVLLTATCVGHAALDFLSPALDFAIRCCYSKHVMGTCNYRRVSSCLAAAGDMASSRGRPRVMDMPSFVWDPLLCEVCMACLQRVQQETCRCGSVAVRCCVLAAVGIAVLGVLVALSIVRVVVVWIC